MLNDTVLCKPCIVIDLVDKQGLNMTSYPNDLRQVPISHTHVILILVGIP